MTSRMDYGTFNAQPLVHSSGELSPTRSKSSILRLLRRIGNGFARRWTALIKRRGQRTSSAQHPKRTGRGIIDTIPDDVLLVIFDFYRLNFVNFIGPTYTWHRLAHVCRRWRRLVFKSPRRLDLCIVCTETTSVRKLLRVWPPLPIIISYRLPSKAPKLPAPSAIAALDHRNRICQIQFPLLTRPLLDILSTRMQEPFPALTVLELCSDDETAPVLPESFLGGFTPRLQRISLEGVAFPALPKLLLSTVDLVSLLLDKIPPNTNLSPEKITTCLAMLIRLKFLRLDFQSPRLLLNRSQRAQPLMRALLPSLTWLEFAGVNEYMEDLAARIKAPLLDNINIRFFEQIVFDISQLSQFIACAEKLNFPSQAKVYFHSDFVEILLSPSSGAAGNLTLQVSCTTSDGQVSAMAQICHRASPLLSGVGRLEIDGGEYGHSQDEWERDFERSQWLELLYPFIAVESLHITEHLGPLVASALREVTRATAAEVLPALRSLLLEKPEPSEFVEGAIRRFIKMRGPSKHPVAVFRQQSDWEDDLWGA